MDDRDQPSELKIGVTLRNPQHQELIQLKPKDFLKRWSVPLVKIGKVYKSIR